MSRTTYSLHAPLLSYHLLPLRWVIAIRSQSNYQKESTMYREPFHAPASAIHLLLSGCLFMPRMTAFDNIEIEEGAVL